MKRFFKPIEKDGSAKKPALSPSKNNGETEKSETSQEENNKREPLKFLTWNANSLLLRVKNNWPEFSKFVTSFDPDIIEVRMPAAGSKGAPKNPGELKDDTGPSREEKRTLLRALSSPPFEDFQVWWSLADSKYAGTALLVKKCFKPKKYAVFLQFIFSLFCTVIVFNFWLQLTVTSCCFFTDLQLTFTPCFLTVHGQLTAFSSFINLSSLLASKHEPDGRVILAEFETFHLLNTYSPNNGWKEEENSFQRRRKWDKRILEFVMQRSEKPLIWCGDLNVSHEEIDVSHPEFFSAAKLNGYIPPNKEDCGQPGFTLAERKRFGDILKEGRLVDAYRFLHKEKDMDCGFSWSGNPIGKYRGKRMRIDYFVVSEELKDRIAACEMHGRGIELEVKRIYAAEKGNYNDKLVLLKAMELKELEISNFLAGFYGSDHCPVSLELLPANPDSNQISP
ncbi:hypothetical protein JRO89_XS13G0081000 [Xanthoceras sorbifolium]|uniref:Endonuclease/exonuclease/phosphatase domain-containing protein n=1 Tax=Xanthoceras sorbifolium TaxID=99658 RepID=A0ABQ8H787_9ROSI|nr:hypothetical protein JRO89_XS13G0081000 [Xanthoceras sorbifolium]